MITVVGAVHFHRQTAVGVDDARPHQRTELLVRHEVRNHEGIRVERPAELNAHRQERNGLGFVEVRDRDDIHEAVLIEIADGQAVDVSSQMIRGNRRAVIAEVRVAVVLQQGSRVGSRDDGLHVEIAVKDDVGVTVIVVVQHGRAPTKRRRNELAHPGIRKRAVLLAQEPT